MITHNIELSCDSDDCHNAYPAALLERVTVKAIRTAAKADGWVHRKGKDLCPADAEAVR